MIKNIFHKKELVQGPQKYAMIDYVKRNLNLDIFVGNTLDGTTSGAYLHADSSSDDAYIGAKKPGATVEQPWKGYIYDFHLYVSSHTDTVTTHASVCAASNCSTLEFNQYDDVANVP